jgi:signal transduction histidine kinase
MTQSHGKADSASHNAGEQSMAALQQRIDLLERQLREAQRLTALGELVSTTTHEFNNVLMTVINYAKLGLRHKDEPSRNKAFEKILSAGNRAAKITATVLGLARNRSEGLEPTDLGKLIEDALVLLEREMNKYRISVDKQLSETPPAMANGNQIQQVLLNLLTNARQAMSGGGTLIIRLEHLAEENMVQLVVRDTGCGIPADKLPRIFDSFYSTKDGPDASGKGGTGLGLSMCRSIIEAHRGKIRVDSSVGKGTAFTIKLPIAAKPQGAKAPLPTLGIPTAQSRAGSEV